MPGQFVNTYLGPGPVSSAVVNASSSGDNTIVAGVAGSRIVVLSFLLVAAAAVAVTWESGGGTVLSGPKAFGANGGACPAVDEGGMFATVAGEALVLNLSGAFQVGGYVKYAVVRGA